MKVLFVNSSKWERFGKFIFGPVIERFHWSFNNIQTDQAEIWWNFLQISVPLSIIISLSYIDFLGAIFRKSLAHNNEDRQVVLD